MLLKAYALDAKAKVTLKPHKQISAVSINNVVTYAKFINFGTIIWYYLMSVVGCDVNTVCVWSLYFLLPV